MSNYSLGMIKVSEKLSVSILFFASLILFFFAQGLPYSLVFITCALLHESSHLYFLHKYGAKITRITLYPFGVDICADTGLLSYKREIVCTLAGSLSNLVCAAVSAFVIHFYTTPLLLFFVMCNIFLGSFNLIPLSFFDGGKALRLFLYDRLDIDNAFYVHKALDVFSALIFLCFSLFMITGSDFNLSVICVVIYASVSTFAAYIKIPCREP